jgi:hypothetical protein
MTCNIIIQIVSMDSRKIFDNITDKPFDPVACRLGALVGRAMDFLNAQSCQCVARADPRNRP